jgi:hypothetical protein
MTHRRSIADVRAAIFCVCGFLLCVLTCSVATAQENSGSTFSSDDSPNSARRERIDPDAAALDVFGDGFGDGFGNGSDGGGGDGSVVQAGWWHHQDECPAPCDQQAVDPYCLPGNSTAPVIIDNGPCPPGCPTAGPVAGPIAGPVAGPLIGPYAGVPTPPDPFFPYAKNKILQDARANITWLPRNGGGGIGFIDVEDESTFALPVPLPGDKSYLLLTPYGETHFVDGPDAADLPHRLYDADLLVQFLSQTPDNVLFYAGADPGLHTDGKSFSSDAWRVALYGAIGYRFSPTFAFGIGVGYLDRRDIGLIPIGGVIWVPNPDTRFELYPPKPRIERRICNTEAYDDWIYIGGELGGGEWAFERPGGVHDVASYRDWRALLGIERRSKCGGLGGMAEVGYTFSRRLEFASSTPTYDPPDTFLVRVGVIY